MADFVGKARINLESQLRIVYLGNLCRWVGEWDWQFYYGQHFAWYDQGYHQGHVPPWDRNPSVGFHNWGHRYIFCVSTAYTTSRRLYCGKLNCSRWTNATCTMLLMCHWLIITFYKKWHKTWLHTHYRGGLSSKLAVILLLRSSIC